MKKRTMLVGAFLALATISFGQQVQTMPTFSNETEKAEWIKNHPQEYERMSGEKVSVSSEKEMTAEEKAAWIKANPEAYRAQGGNPEAVETSEEPRVKEIVINPNDPTFPKFIMTGNPEQDAKDFEAKKNAWYEAQEAAEKAAYERNQEKLNEKQ